MKGKNVWRRELLGSSGCGNLSVSFVCFLFFFWFWGGGGCRNFNIRIRRPCLALAEAGRRPGPPLVWSFAFAVLAAPAVCPPELPRTSAAAACHSATGLAAASFQCQCLPWSQQTNPFVRSPLQLHAIVPQALLFLPVPVPAVVATNPFLRFQACRLPPGKASNLRCSCMP